jgi:hypothetical protein
MPTIPKMNRKTAAHRAVPAEGYRSKTQNSGRGTSNAHAMARMTVA